MSHLSPRYNLFRFYIPKEIIPDEISDKWTELLNRNVQLSIRTPIDLLNSSIVGVSMPGIENSVVMQKQTGKNEINSRTEPASEVAYRSTQSVYESVKPEITVTFRILQGFYNYLLLYESWFYHAMKVTKEIMPDLYLEFLNDKGEIVMHMILNSPVFSGMSGLELSYNRVERSNDEFTITFSGASIDFDFSKTYPGESSVE